MRQKALLLASCFGIAALAFVAPAQAIRCYCYPGYQTSQNWGMGASCADANNDLRAHLAVEANEICAPDLYCSLNVQYTTTCWQPTPTTWQADGFATFGCRICGDYYPFE